MKIDVQMLGEFALRSESGEAVQAGLRSKRNWSLLAYLILYRHKTVSTDKIIDLLWGEDFRNADMPSDPINALKVVFHRIRALLNGLGDGAGYSLILCQGKNYTWNNDIEISLDIDKFEQLCRDSVDADDEKKIELLTEAVNLYHGEFLPQLSSETWVMSLKAYYHNMYIQAVLGLLPLLESRGCYEEAGEICRLAVSNEPYQEEFYYHLINMLCKMDDFDGAVSVYEGMRDMFFNEFGVMPAEEIQSLYRYALSNINDNLYIPPGVIMDSLRESHISGAFVCDFDVFKHIYRAYARQIIRSGDIAHIALFSVAAKDGGDLPRRKLGTAIENFGKILQSSLRRGDVISRCSLSQFVVMLNEANLENSHIICTKIIRSFQRRHPHSPAVFSAVVNPIEPN